MVDIVGKEEEKLTDFLPKTNLKYGTLNLKVKELSIDMMR